VNKRDVHIGRFKYAFPRSESISQLHLNSKQKMKESQLEIQIHRVTPSSNKDMSVLANAAHVNKQVIYAYGEDGTVIGRQLIAINSDFQLVGFHNYVNCDGVIKADYEEIVTHFARFARRIARESNIQLPTDDPAPTVENLGGHFWYDDGIHPWHAAIREA
jgi:hypothetical protein